MSPQQRTKASRKLTAKGSRTRASLLEAAREVFEQKGYFGTSVSEIGRRCGVSQGTFYQYFSNKEQVFRELTDTILGRFWTKADAVPNIGDDFGELLRRKVGVLFEHAAENADFHLVLNEFELIDLVTIGYFDSIARFYRSFFRQAVNNGQIKAIDPNVIAYSLIGIAAFNQMDWGSDSPRFSQPEAIDLTVRLLEGGISGAEPWNRPTDLTRIQAPLNGESGIQWDDDDSAGGQTRRAIFQAAEQVIGRFGYHGAAVSEITRRAGVAQGTFYVHFESKEDLMRGVVRFLSREMRRELRRATDRSDDARDRERIGMITFFRFLKQHAQIYRVVAESETIGREVAQWYYRKLAAGYTESLTEAIAAGQIVDLPSHFVAHYLMGLNHMLGLKWLVWNSSPTAEVSPQAMEDAIELALFGLSPRR